MDAYMPQPKEKKMKYASSFKSEWMETWDFIAASPGNRHRAFCKICQVDISIEHGGKSDVTQHQKSAKHKRNAESQNGTKTEQTPSPQPEIPPSPQPEIPIEEEEHQQAVDYLLWRQMDAYMPQPNEKKRKYASSFKSEWMETCDFIAASPGNKHQAFCKICHVDISIEHAGKSDVTKHQNTDKHRRNVVAQKGTPSIDSFINMQGQSLTEAEQIINAEVIMSMIIAHSNIPFSFCETLNKVVSRAFSDSTIAQKYSAGRTKSTQIVKGAIAMELNDEVSKICQNQPFSLLCFESNIIKTEREFVILARIYDEHLLQVSTKFLDMPICNIVSAENLFEKIESTLKERSIPWKGLVAFNSDNCSVMKDNRKSVISRLRTSQPTVQDMGCICHLVQLATGCGVGAIKLPVESFLTGIYYHFDKSAAKRIEQDKEFVAFTDSDSLKLLRYCATRWLSLLPCIERVLNQWEALQAYFVSHEDVEKIPKILTLASHLLNPEMKAYFMFLNVALKPLAQFNIAFQSEGVMIHRLEREMTTLIRKFMANLVPVRSIKGTPLTEVDYHGQENQLSDEDLYIGSDTKEFLRNEDLPPTTTKRIFQTVRAFYEAVIGEMLEGFPIDSQILRDLRVLDPTCRDDIPLDTVERLRVLFPQLGLKADELRLQFIDYQMMTNEDLPQEERVDRFWGLLGKEEKFKTLAALMKAMLCIPHSNAGSERAFTMLNNILTDNTMSMDNSTLCALLSVKINYTGLIHMYVPSEKVLSAAKSATYEYNT